MIAAAVLWIATYVSGAPHLANHQPTLQFDAATKRVSGSAGCNRYTGTYEESGTHLRFSPLAVTRMMCAGSANLVEGAFIRALDEVRTMRSNGATLRLYGENGVVLVRFTKE